MSETGNDEAHEIGLQFSVYPLRQAHLRPAIESAVRAAVAEGVTAQVGRLSTVASGDEEAVFRALKAAFGAARALGPTVMVATLSSRLPADDAVASIQEAATP